MAVVSSDLVGSDEQFVVGNGDLSTTEGNVQNAVGLLDLANDPGSFVVGSTNEQWLTGAGVTSEDGTAWHLTVSGGNPFEVTVGGSDQVFVLVVRIFITTIWHVAGTVRWDNLAGNEVSIVVSSTNLQIKWGSNNRELMIKNRSLT